MRIPVHWIGENGFTLCGLENPSFFSCLDSGVTCKGCGVRRRVSTSPNTGRTKR